MLLGDLGVRLPSSPGSPGGTSGRPAPLPEINGFGPVPALGGLWMWLQLRRLQFEVIRGPVGVVWTRFGVGLGPSGPQACPTSTPNDPRPDLGPPQTAAT